MCQARSSLCNCHQTRFFLLAEIWLRHYSSCKPSKFRNSTCIYQRDNKKVGIHPVNFVFLLFAHTFEFFQVPRRLCVCGRSCAELPDCPAVVKTKKSTHVTT
uniref:Putative ovule protein n=1 Tax=Solanum chacoense TaxID=4108 RepID=A0A0V0GV02_SOLCH